MSKARFYLGLMSGTSADGIDLALVDCRQSPATLIASHYHGYDDNIHQQITALYRPGQNEIDRAFGLDITLARLFAEVISQFLVSLELSAADIIAIGNHGQTIRHRPDQNDAFTLQIGCCQTLATLTNIKVIGQFRRKDMALGGQGAPLVPAFHQALFSEPAHDVFVVNIGGIANISYLPAQNPEGVLGFDTGPGNGLMDEWCKKHHHGNFDEHGNWAASGTVDQQLLIRLLADDFFQRPAPKSTGREYFHLQWLSAYLSNVTGNAQDIQATLAMLTAQSIANAITALSATGKIYLCGGGVHNFHLKKLLNQQLTNYEILLTNHKDISSDSLEAMAFAWFAFAYDKMLFGNIPAVTGASKKTVLGTVFNP